MVRTACVRAAPCEFDPSCGAPCVRVRACGRWARRGAPQPPWTHRELADGLVLHVPSRRGGRGRDARGEGVGSARRVRRGGARGHRRGVHHVHAGVHPRVRRGGELESGLRLSAGPRLGSWGHSSGRLGCAERGASVGRRAVGGGLGERRVMGGRTTAVCVMGTRPGNGGRSVVVAHLRRPLRSRRPPRCSQVRNRITEWQSLVLCRSRSSGVRVAAKGGGDSATIVLRGLFRAKRTRGRCACATDALLLRKPKAVLLPPIFSGRSVVAQRGDRPCRLWLGCTFIKPQSQPRA